MVTVLNLYIYETSVVLPVTLSTEVWNAVQKLIVKLPRHCDHHESLSCSINSDHIKGD